MMENLECRRLLSVYVDLPDGSQGLKLPDGGWLFVDTSRALSGTQADGSLDPAFGTNGIATVPGVKFGSGSILLPAVPIALDDHGDILVAGTESGAAVVARFRANGSIDSTFGDKGLASVSLGAANASFFAVALQKDGKIVAVGDSDIPNLDQSITQFTVARFNSDGTLDKTFNNGGVFSTGLGGTKAAGIGDLADTVAIQKDGKIVVGGFAQSTKGPTNPATGFGLIRLDANGTLDTKFGDSGKVVTYFRNAKPAIVSTDSAMIFALFARDDGTILAVGPGQDLQVVAALYNADGSLDNNWGIGGRLLVYAVSGRPEATQLTGDGGFKVFDNRNSDDVTQFLEIGPDGKTPNPNPVDPTPTSNDSQTINPPNVPTTTNVTVPAVNAAVGAGIVLTAHIATAGGQPVAEGSVGFAIGTADGVTTVAADVSNGSASAVFPIPLPVGVYQIGASYADTLDMQFANSSGFGTLTITSGQTPIVSNPAPPTPEPPVVIGSAPFINVPAATTVDMSHVTFHAQKVHAAVAERNLAAALAIVKHLNTKAALPTAAINWGDGSPVESASLSVDPKHPTIARVFGSHMYGLDGTYHVILNLVSGSQTFGTMQLTVHVNGVLHVKAGRRFSNVLGFVPASTLAPTSASQTRTLIIDWGDNTSTTTPIINTKGAIDAFKGSHVYAMPGNYVVTISENYSSAAAALFPLITSVISVSAG